MKNENEKLGTPKWLKRVQEQSWEPEILISGVVLLALFQLPDKVDLLGDYLLKFSYPIFSGGNSTVVLVAFIKIAIYWLLAGFGTHLFFRSIWVAYIGLSYAYPKGTKMDRFKFHKRYKKLIISKSSYIESITRLEKLCSSMFALSFLLFMLIVGVLSFSCVILAILFPISLYAPQSIVFTYIGSFINLLCIILLFDFLTLGLLKRIPYVSAVYYPLYRFLSLLTLSFLYRDIYYNFISNHRKRYIIIFMGVFIGITAILLLSLQKRFEVFDAIKLTGLTDGAATVKAMHYANLSDENIIRTAQIPADIISGDVLKVFIAHRSHTEEFGMKGACFTTDSLTLEKSMVDSVKLNCLNNYYQLGINDSIFTSNYLFMEHPKTKQPGLIAYLDIAYLPRKQHLLKLLYKNINESSDSIPYYPAATIEFFKD